MAAESSPFPVKTEREKAVEDKNLPIYRTIFQKHSAKRAKGYEKRPE
jgi:hypothetical protein